MSELLQALKLSWTAEDAASRVQRYLAEGAQVRAKDKYNGVEPLHWAVRNQTAEALVAVVPVLLAAGQTRAPETIMEPSRCTGRR